MDRPVRNKKSVDYSQFLDLENDDEDFASSVPSSKKSRVETKKEKKEKPTKKPIDETSSPKNSQGKRLPLDEKIYKRDLEVALALSVQETSVIIENDENTSRSVSPAFFPGESKDPEVSFSNCSVDSDVLGLDEITESNEEPVNGRSRRQAASKAITEQRKLLKDESSSEDDADEFKPDTAVYGDSDSDESYSGDDEEFEVKKSKKAATSKVPKAKNEKKGKSNPKARRKDGDSENDSSFSCDEEFEVKKSKKTTESKCPKTKNAKKENASLSKAASIPSPASVSIKIKPMTAKHTSSSSPALAKPTGHSSHSVGMKRPAWSPPASSGSVGSPLTGVTVRSPNQGLRLGLSRLARVKPLHPAPVHH
ncbi:PREDICTED: RAD51-associated protein 1 [Nanorana parkeri]|uniref:RAD51-associated protein 1 n=1 Tax=Nanorana parkeri TaxID=125878 RepID=UPI000854E7A1|nr:PREDICTED: RAD51-associated protein 1 [Nanorana parkeri]